MLGVSPLTTWIYGCCDGVLLVNGRGLDLVFFSIVVGFA